MFGETRSLADAPPPIGAATLVITTSGRAVGTDPDRDRVSIVDLDRVEVSATVPFEKGDMPGRVVDDGKGHVHVVLQRAGAVATIDVATGDLIDRRAVCPAPRGIATLEDTIVVACAGGELVSLPAVGGEATVITRLDPDLRDMVVDGSRLVVSRLRSAEILRLGLDGALIDRMTPSMVEGKTPSVAWRMVAPRKPDAQGAVGGVLLAHQLAQEGTVSVSTGATGTSAYASSSIASCDGPVANAVTAFSFNGGQPPTPRMFGGAVLPVDLAASPSGDIALIAAGNGHHWQMHNQVHLASMSDGAGNGCGQLRPKFDPPGQAVAVSFRPSGGLVVLTREPAGIHVVDPSILATALQKNPWITIPLGGASREDTGHAIFHSNTGGNIACASCHPDGADDSRTWQFSDTGPRRTQSLQGNLAGTAPYHWNGDVPNIAHVGNEVFTKRMAGQQLALDQLQALEAYLLRIPRVPPSVRDADGAARGKALFESANIGCTSCHAGAALTNNASVDIGTGGRFQVPSLVGVALHAPYLHDGRMRTLAEIFGPVGGERHGNTGGLSEAELQDLLLYLETL